MKLDLGCGKNKKPDFTGVDAIKFEGVDIVADLTKPWPFENDSVDEVHCSHFIEHLEGKERIFFVNELHRVLKKGAKALLIAPHCFSERAYGDLTHKWPPVAGFWFYYLSKDWRATQAPHDDILYNPAGYSCDFDAAWGYAIHPEIQLRSQPQQEWAAKFYKEAVQDIICTLTKK
jgi:SAM-dependent methyltransferase